MNIIRFAAYVSLGLFPAGAYGGSRTSANYSVPADVNDLGGLRAVSANYTNNGSAGSVVGISTVASPAETAKDGYIGQLTELVSFGVAAAPNNIPQGATSQLSGSATL